MRVSLIPFDSKIANVALMKLSMWHKRKNDTTGLYLDNPDKAYISCIYTWNGDQCRGLTTMYDCPVEIGGSGVDIGSKLAHEIEHMMPDYELYPDVDYSIGLTSRGCIRNCPFCIVRQKEGYIQEHASFEEFVNPEYDKILLLDSNFIVSPKHKEKIEWLIDNGYRTSLQGGLDIRAMDEEDCKLLHELKPKSISFNDTRYYFAWDMMEYTNQILPKIEMVKNSEIRNDRCMFYILVGFNTSFEEDLYRVHKLMSYDFKPFIMKYNNKQDSKLNALARWLNRRYYTVTDWEGFDGNKWNDEYDTDAIMKKYDKIYTT